METTMTQDIENAIQYVRENKNWSEAEEAVALERIDHWRCPLSQAAPNIGDGIRDLMNEFAADNDLPEDFWTPHIEEDDIFFQL